MSEQVSGTHATLKLRRRDLEEVLEEDRQSSRGMMSVRTRTGRTTSATPCL